MIVNSRNQCRRRWGRGTPLPDFHGTVPHGSFGWVNQGGATVAQKSSQAVLLTAPAGVGDNWRVRQAAAPTPPYSLVVALWPVLAPAVSAGEYPAVGVGWRESGTGRLGLFTVGWSVTTYGTLVADFSHWTGPTALSAVAGGPTYTPWLQWSGALWVKLQDDNTSRLVWLSPDGVDWTYWFVEARTNFLTPDQLVFAANADNASYEAIVKVLDWHLE